MNASATGTVTGLPPRTHVLGQVLMVQSHAGWWIQRFHDPADARSPKRVSRNMSRSQRFLPAPTPLRSTKMPLSNAKALQMDNYGTEGREFESLRARQESPAQAGFLSWGLVTRPSLCYQNQGRRYAQEGAWLPSRAPQNVVEVPLRRARDRSQVPLGGPRSSLARCADRGSRAGRSANASSPSC